MKISVLLEFFFSFFFGGDLNYYKRKTVAVVRISCGNFL